MTDDTLKQFLEVGGQFVMAVAAWEGARWLLRVVERWWKSR